MRVAVCAMVNTVNMVFTVWSLSFATSIVGLERSTMLLVSVIANAVSRCWRSQPPLCSLTGSGANRCSSPAPSESGLMMFPYLGAVSAGNWTLIFVFGAIMSGCAYSLANSIWPSFYAEMFPTTARVTGLALGTQVGFAVSGGLAPVLASAVAGAGGENWVSVAAFTAGVCIVVGLVAMTAKETKGLSLEEIDTVHEERSR
jgi:hypothetical protein